MNRQIKLARFPADKLSANDFFIANGKVPEPGPGQLLVRTQLISIDAANRAWIQGSTYRSVIGKGTVMAGLAISEVVVSNSPAFRTGDLVLAESGWQQLAVVDAASAIKQPPVAEITHLLSVYGTSSLTAHIGLLTIGQLKADDTLVVSAAAGSVGTAVGQIAKIVGARVIGIAGGQEKCAWLVEELGFDGAIDYRDNISLGLRHEVPDGIDVYFDNVGGEVFERCLFAMKDYGRIVCCGAVSLYDGPKPPSGPRGVPGLIVTKRLTLQGFIVTDHGIAQPLEDLRRWVSEGKFRPVEAVIEGLDAAPQALVDQLAGANRGKCMVRVN